MANDKVEVFPAAKLKEPKVFTDKVKWIGLNELYFVAAAVPQNAPQLQATLMETPPNLLTATASLPQNAAAGHEVTASYAFYFGPKDVNDLKAANLGLDGVLHFGWFDFLARPCLTFLKWLNSYVHNYGWSIDHPDRSAAGGLLVSQPQELPVHEGHAEDPAPGGRNPGEIQG